MGKYIGDKLTFQIINDGSQGKLNDKVIIYFFLLLLLICLLYVVK